MGDLKIFDLSTLKYQYNLGAFLETGTFQGAGIEFARYYFDEVHSIEIDKDLYQDVKIKYSSDPGVNLYLGESYKVLEQILPDIKCNVLFWLDAHFPGADLHKVAYDHEQDYNKRAPLKAELTAISKRTNTYKDVIIIDDLWLYEEGNYEWGTFDAHMQRCGQNVKLKDVIKDNSDFIYKLFENTHEFEKRAKHQGYLIIKPK